MKVANFIKMKHGFMRVDRREQCKSAIVSFIDLDSMKTTSLILAEEGGELVKSIKKEMRNED